MTPLTRLQLDREDKVDRCDKPGCDCRKRILRPACHPREAGLLVEYDAATGVLSTACPICRTTILQILVASAAGKELH